MDHNAANEQLSAFLDGEMPPAERAELEGHLAGCADCRSTLDELKRLSAMVRARRVEAPARLRAKVLAEARPSPAWTAWLKPIAGLSVAAAALAVVIEVKNTLPGLVSSKTESMISGAAGGLEADSEHRALQNEPKLQAAAKKADRPMSAPAAFPAAAPAAPAPARAEARGAYDSLLEKERVSGYAREEKAKSSASATSANELAGGGGFGGGSGLRDLKAGSAMDAGSGSMSAQLGRRDEFASRQAAMKDREALEGAKSLRAAGAPIGAALSGAPAESPEASADAASVDKTEPPPAQEWTGSALYGPKQVSKVVIRDTEGWIKFWPMLSSEPLPLLDFDAQMVVGVVAGGAPASVRITGIETAGGQTVVRYTRRPAAAEGPVPSYQYQLKAIPKSDRTVRFEEAR